MHEAGLLSAAVLALAEAEPGGVGEVVLEIGPQVDEAAAANAWTAAVAGSPFEGARVVSCDGTNTTRAP